MSLGENIRRRREALKLSQEVVAERLGVSRQAVSKWETGRSEPTAANLVELTKLLETDLSELVEGPKDAPKEAAEPPADRKKPNQILRTNLTLWAIILQAGFLVGFATAFYQYDRMKADTPSKALLIPVFLELILLAACSVWMASNHRFTPDPGQRRKNTYIETAYCALQALLGLLDIRFGMGIVGALLIIAVGLVYILYINPKYMGRKLTK